MRISPADELHAHARARPTNDAQTRGCDAQCLRAKVIFLVPRTARTPRGGSLGDVLTAPNPKQMAQARRLLVHEGADGSAARCAEAAGRVYEKIQAHLAPLVGSAGTRALLVRSAKPTRNEFAFLKDDVVEGAKALREALQAQDPAVATDAAAALFGTFFALVTTFIGERLTTQVLRRAGLTFEEAASTETEK